jgi:hypothetical protein
MNAGTVKGLGSRKSDLALLIVATKAVARSMIDPCIVHRG